MTIGEYVPTAILNGGDAASQAITVATLKTREAAARLSRLQALAAFSSDNRALSISEEDRQYFVSNRIDRISSQALQEQLYALELRITAPVPNKLQEQILDLRSRVQSVMSDVEASVYDMNEVIKQLSSFRDTYPDRYKAAFISPSVPEVLEPLVLYDILPATDSLLSVSSSSSSSSSSNSNNSDDSSSSSSEFVVSDRSWHEPLREFSALSVGDEEAAKYRTTLTNLVNEGDTNLLPKVSRLL